MRDWPVFAVIPACDEESALPLVLRDLCALELDLAEILVVDNGSRDRTAERARAGGATVLYEPRRGYGAACWRSLERVAKRANEMGEGDAVLVFLAADHSDHPEDIARLVEPIRDDRADLTVGSRLVYPEARAALPLAARIRSRAASWLLRALHGARVGDPGPMRAIRLSTLDRLDLRDRSSGWRLEMLLAACREQLALEEVPVRCRAPRSGGWWRQRSLLPGTRAAGPALRVLVRHLLAGRR